MAHSLQDLPVFGSFKTVPLYYFSYNCYKEGEKEHWVKERRRNEPGLVTLVGYCVLRDWIRGVAIRLRISVLRRSTQSPCCRLMVASCAKTRACLFCVTPGCMLRHIDERNIIIRHPTLKKTWNVCTHQWPRNKSGKRIWEEGEGWR